MTENPIFHSEEAQHFLSVDINNCLAPRQVYIIRARKKRKELSIEKYNSEIDSLPNYPILQCFYSFHNKNGSFFRCWLGKRKQNSIFFCVPIEMKRKLKVSVADRETKGSG